MSIIHQLCFSKIARLHRSCIYTANQSILDLFKLDVNYSSTLFQAKLHDCIGVTYTAIQSILKLFKLEVNYSSTLFWQKCKIVKRVTYTAPDSILELFKLEVNY